MHHSKLMSTILQRTIDEFEKVKREKSEVNEGKSNQYIWKGKIANY